MEEEGTLDLDFDKLVQKMIEFMQENQNGKSSNADYKKNEWL